MENNYSNPIDITDSLIWSYSKPSDHVDAKDYVDKVLLKCGKSPEEIKGGLLRELSVVYATYKRAFYESKTSGDVFYKKYKEYETRLRDLTADLIRIGVGKTI